MHGRDKKTHHSKNSSKAVVRIRRYRRSRFPLATSEDLKAVSNNAVAARKVIQRYQRELLLVADTQVHQLPVGMMSRPEFPEDALSLLESSLTWVSKLADSYTASFAATLVKSKGLLYFTAYVRLSEARVTDFDFEAKLRAADKMLDGRERDALLQKIVESIFPGTDNGGKR